MGRSDEQRKEKEVLAAWRTLRAVVPALPKKEDIALQIEDAEAAQKRGYFLPDEDERLRDVYVTYLGVRLSLWETVLSLKPYLDDERNERDNLHVFGLAFCAAAMLVRSADSLVELARGHSVVWKKLDEAEPRYGLEKKNFTTVYKSLSSARWQWRFYDSWQFYNANRESILNVLRSRSMGEVAEWLEEEEGLFQIRKREYVKRKLRYRWHSITRRHASGYKQVMFSLLKLGGSIVAEMKHPFGKRARQPGAEQEKRVTASVQQEIREVLQAGDVLVTRHDDAVSNLFLPGFWPHAALYIGAHHEREQLGVQADEERVERAREEICFLEAKKDGVLFRKMEETLHVDAFVVLRPVLPEVVRAEVLSRALTHEGKLYDFEFDFRKSDRLACTGLIYRAYHGADSISWELKERSGRHCFSAEDFLNQSLEAGWFEVVACFGVGDDVMRLGKVAESRVRASLRKAGEA